MTLSEDYLNLEAKAEKFAKHAEILNIEQAMSCCESCEYSASQDHVRVAVLRWAKRAYIAGFKAGLDEDVERL